MEKESTSFRISIIHYPDRLWSPCPDISHKDSLRIKGSSLDYILSIFHLRSQFLHSFHRREIYGEAGEKENNFFDGFRERLREVVVKIPRWAYYKFIPKKHRKSIEADRVRFLAQNLTTIPVDYGENDGEEMYILRKWLLVAQLTVWHSLLYCCCREVTQVEGFYIFICSQLNSLEKKEKKRARSINNANQRGD